MRCDARCLQFAFLIYHSLILSIAIFDMRPSTWNATRGKIREYTFFLTRETNPCARIRAEVRCSTRSYTRSLTQLYSSSLIDIFKRARTRAYHNANMHSSMRRIPNAYPYGGTVATPYTIIHETFYAPIHALIQFIFH